jgi:hypothetical protein
LARVAFCTRNDDNFLGEKDGILACLGNSGGTRATPFECLKDSFGSFLGVKTNDPYAVEGLVLIQGEVDVVRNQIWREVLKWIMKREAWLVKHAPKPFLSSPDPDNADAALSCFWGSQRQIPNARTLAPTGRNSSLSLGRFRRLSAAGEAAIV